MRIFATDAFELPLPEGHPFPMAKYRRLRERVEEDGLATTPAPAASDEDLRLVHDRAYLWRVFTGTLEDDEVRRLGFPWSPELVERSRRSVGATVAAAEAALEDGVAVSLAGGTHHARSDHGAGYCQFNDVAVAARAMQARRGLRRVAIVDTDVHQGDGSAAVFAEDESVVTFSIHGARNFPRVKIPGDLDVALPDETTDDEYLERLGEALDDVLARPALDLVLVVSGADPWEGDRLGRLSLTKDGLARRDRIVQDACKRRRLPVAVTMGGGYAPEVEDIVDIHLETVRAANRRYSSPD